MHLLKQFIIRLDLTSMYDGTVSEKEYLLQQLQAKYEKICAFNCYIDKVVEITSHSLFMANMSDLRGSFQVDVSFIAQVIMYRPGEMLSNVQIVRKNEQLCGVISTHTNVVIAPSAITSQIDDMPDKPIIPIIVQSATYKDNQKHITVFGVFEPYPIKQEPIYAITDKLTDIERSVLRNMAELARAIKIPDTDKAGKYRALLYAYKTPKPMPKNVIDFLDEKQWDKLPGMRVQYSVDIARETPYCRVDESKDRPISASAFNVLNIFIGMHYSHLLLLDNLCTNYPELDKVSPVLRVLLSTYYKFKPNE